MLPEAAIRSQLTGQIRIGRVSSVDAKRHSVQVKFEEQDGFVSWDLQVLRGFASDYCLPAQNTPVLCLLIDGRLGVGYVLGAVYTDSDAAPLDDAGQRAVVGDDMRLGTADASDKVSLSSKCKSEHDKIKAELDKIAVTLGTGATPIGGGTVTFGTPYSNGYSTSGVGAEKVSAK